MLLAVSMFDAGNSPFNCGGAYALTAALTGGERLTVRSVLGRMLRSVPFDTFLVILLLGLLGLRLAADGLHRGGDVRSGQRLSGDADDRIAAGAADSAGEPVRRSAGGSAALRIRPGGLRRLLDAAAACRDPAGAGAEPSGAVPSVSLAYCERCGCDSGAVGAIHSLCIPISLAFTLLVCLM